MEKKQQDEVYVTHYGERIALRSGYRKGLPPMPALTPEAVGEYARQPENVWGVVHDLFSFMEMKTLLEESGALPAGGRYRSLLDIGGQTGLVATLFKSAGLADAVSCIDIADYHEAVSPALLQEVHSLFAKAQEQEAIANGQEYARLSRMLTTHRSLYPGYRSHLYWRGAEKHLPEQVALDNYLCADVYNLNEQFELVTAFSSFDYFSPRPFFLKARDLVAPGGTLALMLANWWWIINGPQVFGDIPLLTQRLIRTDVERFMRTYHPEDAIQAMHTYDYFNMGEPGLLLGDYFATAEACGFLPLGYRRATAPGGNLPSKMANWTLLGDHGPQTLQEVLRDIHHFNPRVSAIDLLTSMTFVVFERV